MKFYNREKEIEKLIQVRKLAAISAQMTFVVGRRRIGKTRLLLNANEDVKSIYFFVARKNEALLCAEWVELIQDELGITIYGEIKSFSVLFELLLKESKKQSFTLIIDEFQDFKRVNASVYSDMQRLWDTHKEESKINLILCGSVYAMMKKIFEHSKEPLFGRATQRIHVKPFEIDTIKEILSDFHPTYSSEDLLAFYMITGGVAKYIEVLIENNAFTKEKILDTVLSENSLFIEEGKNVLIEEFGKDYGNYFSILSLIASGKTARVEIESILEVETGGFLSRLEHEYNIIKSIRSVLAKEGTRSVKYKITDKFLSFWFRFIFKYRSAVESGNIAYIKAIVERDYNTYSGSVLEDYFIEKIKAQKQYNLIGNYWERKNKNEIDIVAINDLEQKVLIAEIKRQKKNININDLKEKSLKIQSNFKKYTFEYKGFSMEGM